jgi:hypothetical protein
VAAKNTCTRAAPVAAKAPSGPGSTSSNESATSLPSSPTPPTPSAIAPVTSPSPVMTTKMLAKISSVCRG